MELRTKTIRLMDGKNLVVHEADASYDARMALLVNEANTADHNDKNFLFFWRTYYPILAACANGQIPTPAEAYALPADVLDEWYLTVWELNQDILGATKEARSRVVEFRDGSSLTAHETLDLPSFTLRIVALENEALNRENVPASEVSFRTYVYPRVAGCSSGNVPSVEEAIKYPRAELAKWSAIVMDLNPKLFQFIVDEAARVSPLADKEEVKKKRENAAHIISRLSPLFRKASTAIPNQSAVTPAQVSKWWDYWILWQLVKKDLPSFVILSAWEGALPKEMMDVFLELDNFHSHMEAQRLKEESKNNHG